MSKHSKVAIALASRLPPLVSLYIESRVADTFSVVIARNALAQEESEEFSGDFQDPINIHIENDRDGCAC